MSDGDLIKVKVIPWAGGVDIHRGTPERGNVRLHNRGEAEELAQELLHFARHGVVAKKKTSDFMIAVAIMLGLATHEEKGTADSAVAAGDRARLELAWSRLDKSQRNAAAGLVSGMLGGTAQSLSVKDSTFAF